MKEQIHLPKCKGIINKHNPPGVKDSELNLFGDDVISDVLTFQKSHPLYTNTPLISLNQLAKRLNVKSIHVKDESHRFGLNAFKVMGGIYAVGKYLADQLNKDINELSFEELKSADVKQKVGEITFISATDGNHGRGIAWAARELGQKSIIYLPKESTKARLEAIRNEGAHAEIKDMNYDATVKLSADLAKEKGYVIVQDTAWQGYEEIPLWIMQGYAAIAKEIADETKEVPTHLILQAGVGSFAAGIAAYYLKRYGNQAPKLMIVEPNLADCYYQSLNSPNQEITPVTGKMNSIMAGLCCGEPNLTAYQLLKKYAYASFSCEDKLAALGMRVLGHPLRGDERIISGESGAVPLGLLYYLMEDGKKDDLAALELNEQSKILMISTEGDTDPEAYLDVVWKGHYSN